MRILTSTDHYSVNSHRYLQNVVGLLNRETGQPMYTHVGIVQVRNPKTYFSSGNMHFGGEFVNLLFDILLMQNIDIWKSC